MNDITPPKRSMTDIAKPQRPPVAVPSRQPRTEAPALKLQTQSKQPMQPELMLPKPEPEMPLLDEPRESQHLLGVSKKKSTKHFILWGLGLVVAIVVVAIGSLYIWYTSALTPALPSSTEKVQVHIVQGSSPSAIGLLLEQKQLIRSRMAFDVYTRLSGNRGKLQAGVYNLSASESTQQIVEHLTSGNTEQFSITFLPGATVAENRTVLIEAGYSEDDVDTALAKQYDHPLFATKPETSDLEGYIYGETYSFASNTTVEQILTRTFDEFYKVVQSKNLVSGFQAQGISLYEGITLASIIQREVPGAQDQKQVAQIFLSRLRMGMQLGSDVTAYYGADKEGVERSVAVDTPYNTRIHTGMPPGPIGTPGVTALEAAASPANGDYIYFLSGDDEVTYFAKTDAEHQANIVNHCRVKCSIP